MPENEVELGIKLNGVTFAYPGCEPFITDARLDLPRGSRCLLIGANGTGKTTLLQIVAGEYAGYIWRGYVNYAPHMEIFLVVHNSPHDDLSKLDVSIYFEGKYMVDKSAITVLGRPPFHDTVRFA